MLQRGACCVSVSAAKGNCGRDSPCLSKSCLAGKFGLITVQYRRLKVWHSPNPVTPCPMSLSLSPTRPVSASLLLPYEGYHCTASGRPDLSRFVVDVVSRSRSLQHLELNTDSSTSPGRDAFSSSIESQAHGHAEASVACDANADLGISLDPHPQHIKSATRSTGCLSSVRGQLAVPPPPPTVP